MKCQNCGENEANCKYTEIINGIKKEMFFCQSCSEKIGINNLNIPIDFSSFFGDFLNEYNDVDFMSVLGEKKELKCDFCNMTFNEFMQNGKFGCCNCFKVFDKKIEPVLKKLHGDSQHIGKKSTEKKIEIKEALPNEEKIFKLKNDLKEAIKKEEYENAAKIRDEIKKLENN